MSHTTNYYYTIAYNTSMFALALERVLSSTLLLAARTLDKPDYGMQLDKVILG